MQHNAPFCILLNIPSPPTAFSLSRVGMYDVHLLPNWYSQRCRGYSCYFGQTQKFGLFLKCLDNIWMWLLIMSWHFFLLTKDLYSRKDSNLVFSPVSRFYDTTEQKLIHSFWNALRIRRKINQLNQSLCYTSSIYYTTQNNPWICRYRFNGIDFLIFSVSPLIHVK